MTTKTPLQRLADREPDSTRKGMATADLLYAADAYMHEAWREMTTGTLTALWNDYQKAAAEWEKANNETI